MFDRACKLCCLAGRGPCRRQRTSDLGIAAYGLPELLWSALLHKAERGSSSSECVCAGLKWVVPIWQAFVPAKGTAALGVSQQNVTVGGMSRHQRRLFETGIYALQHLTWFVCVMT